MVKRSITRHMFLDVDQVLEWQASKALRNLPLANSGRLLHQEAWAKKLFIAAGGSMIAMGHLYQRCLSQERAISLAKASYYSIPNGLSTRTICRSLSGIKLKNQKQKTYKLFFTNSTKNCTSPTRNARKENSD